MNIEAIQNHQEDCNETRTRLPDGPWMTEPDRREWRAFGFPCLMVRNSEFFNWCGYVGVTRDHPAYGKDLDGIEHLEIHGGLTYAKGCQGVICHLPEPEESDEIWWLGFDCAHADDLWPGVNMATRRLYSHKYHIWNPTYKDVSYVETAVNELARQLEEMKLNSSLGETSSV